METGRLVCGFWLGSMSNQFNEYITDIVKRIRKDMSTCHDRDQSMRNEYIF